MIYTIDKRNLKNERIRHQEKEYLFGAEQKAEWLPPEVKAEKQ